MSNFQKALVPTYTYPVQVSYPIDNGKTLDYTLTISFRRYDTDELKALQERIADMSDEQLLSEILADEPLQGVKINGRKCDLTPGDWEDALKLPQTRPAIVTGFFKSIATAKTKNL